jgi:hypothetical protein
MNNPIIGVGFQFSYDGTSTTVAIHTRRGPLAYSFPSSPGAFSPEFSDVASAAVDVVVGGIPSTATISGGTMTVQIPSGLSAGVLSVTATLQY